MRQVHPGVSLSSSPRQGHVLIIINDKFVARNDSPATLTVWKKSLVFNGNGYTVYDSSGNLVFRVDNYAYDAKHQLFLMDAAGNVLLTLLHKRLSLNNRWEAYRGDRYGSEIEPAFSVIKSVSTLFSRSKQSAKVVLNPAKRQNMKLCDYEIDGSLCNRVFSFTVFGPSREIIAQAKRKVATPEIMLGNDVLSLVVQPGIDQAFVMGLLIIFNQIISR